MWLLFTDTDCFGAAEITSDNVSQEQACFENIIDTSGLHPSHPLHDKTHARVPEQHKIECGEFNIIRFAAIRSKCYAMEMESQDQNLSTIMKCKGVQKAALTKDVTFDDFKLGVFENVTRADCGLLSNSALSLGICLPRTLSGAPQSSGTSVPQQKQGMPIQFLGNGHGTDTVRGARSQHLPRLEA